MDTRPHKKTTIADVCPRPKPNSDLTLEVKVKRDLPLYFCCVLVQVLLLCGK